MPLYEYQCKKCKHRFEKIQSFSDAPIRKCPRCGAAVEKLLSAPAVHFKGSGFYQTDYARKSGSESSSASDFQSEAKPAQEKSGVAGNSGSSEQKSSGQKSSEVKSEKPASSSETNSASSSEPKGDPRGRSTHSKKSRKR